MKSVKALLAVIIFFLTVCGSMNSQQEELKKGNRAVFLSAANLAEACADWNAINPGGHFPKEDDVLNITTTQIAHGVECEWYILGVHDGHLDAGTPPHYHPVRIGLDYMKPMIDTFLKYVKDHPEKQDFAASTVLGEVEKILLKAQTGH